MQTISQIQTLKHIPKRRTAPGCLPPLLAAALSTLCAAWATLKRRPQTVASQGYLPGDAVYLHPIVGLKHDGRRRTVLGWRIIVRPPRCWRAVVISNGDAPPLYVTPESLSPADRWPTC